MKAIILAAGRGSRMNHFTERKPKGLIRVYGKKIIQWQIEILNSLNIYDITLITGYKHDEMREFNCNRIHNKLWSDTNSLYSLMQASEIMKHDDTIVLYSDILYSPSAIKLLMAEDKNLSIPYYTNFLNLWKERMDNPLDDLETFEFNNNKLISIGERAMSFEEIQGQFMGILKIPKNTFQVLHNIYKSLGENDQKKMDITQFLSILLEHELFVNVYSFDDFWFEFDTPRDLEISEMFREKFLIDCGDFI